MRNFRTLSFLAVLAACFFAAFLVEVVSAAPSAPIEQTLLQPDGSLLPAWQWGDEWSNGFDSIEGYTIIKDDQGWWVYAQVVEGQLYSGCFQAWSTGILQLHL